ncbi:MAG: hypothetical protein H6506_02895 [Calditrichaeota bacterium]|nr:hypothetical protein [Calditrichota bacterium]MCB9391582.1 hypothetical protein [Calditrichota bacterium]
MNIREKIGWKLLSWRAKPETNGVVELPGLIRNARRVCVLLPANFDDFDLVRTFLPDVLEKLEGRQVTIWVRDNFRSWLVINELCTVSSYDPSRATRFGLPTPDTLRAAKAFEHDLLIDLSVTPELYVTALADSLRASTKIALEHRESRDLYHVLVESNSTDNARRVSALLQYL